MPGVHIRRAAAFLGLASAWLTLPASAYAQGAHPEQESLPATEVLEGITHGVVQGTAVFLAGLAAFVALVWLPASRSAGVSRGVGSLFSRGAWALFWVLAVAGTADLSVYAVRASGESFSLGLVGEALFETQVGRVSLARLGLGFGFFTVLAIAWAVRQRRLLNWSVAAGVGAALLVTLTLESHAAAESGFLLLLSIWLHVVAASVWAGGLLGFPLLLLGPLRAMEPEEAMELRRRTVHRFSKVATIAVMTVIATGLYATLLYVSGPVALVSTPYGRALIMKLGLVVLLLAVGGINLIDKGEGPFGRMVGAELVLAIGIFVAAGFLTSLPSS